MNEIKKQRGHPMNIDTISTSTDCKPQGPQVRHRPIGGAPASAFHGDLINILIVDDEPKNLTVLETVLNDPGYRLVRAESADQALHALVAEEFALLILDIRMPGMSGFELAKMIKERKKTARVPIIFLTAYYNEDQHVLEGYGSGAVDYLLKPVNPGILRSKVAVIADLHRKSRLLLTEVIERRRAEEDLRELNETLEQRMTERTAALHLTESRYRDLIQALPAAVYTCDGQGRIALYNKAAVALWGREPEIGKDLWCGSWKIYRPDGAPLPLDQCPMAVTLRTGHAIRGEEIIIERADGTRRYVIPYPEPMLNDEGVVLGAVNMLMDISDRKEAEKAIANLAAIVTSSDDAIIGKDLHGIVTSWNHSAERLFGYTATEMIGQPVSRLIPPERIDEESDILERITQGKSVVHYETVRRRKDGAELTISLSVSPVFVEGRIIGASKIARDITEQKRAKEALEERDRALTRVNETLKKQTAALAEANRELEGFSYSVSHDLRAPLRIIDAFSRIMEEEHGSHLNAEVHRGLTIVRKAAGQAGELIDDLLEFSRLGRQGMNFRLVKMVDLAREAADDLMILQKGRQIDLTIEDLPSCQGDRRLLKLVWINLLTNAFKYTKNRNESRVEIGWMPDKESAGMVTYYVKDDGVGFDMKYAHKLFGVFHRLHRKEDFEGTGVGLAIAHRIVSRHGGRIWAEAKVDGGATFFFSLRKDTP
jgi:PAS domain S-box-containing protein